jgi:ribosomal protein L7/L12
MTPDPARDDDRVARLEQQVALLCSALGIKNDDRAHVVPEEVVELIRADQRIQAVRLLRQLTGAKLIAAKRLVDGAAENLGASA